MFRARFMVRVSIRVRVRKRICMNFMKWFCEKLTCVTLTLEDIVCDIS